MVHATCRAWQQREAGDRRMHSAFGELFRRKMATAPPFPSLPFPSLPFCEKGSDMTSQQTTTFGAAIATSAPLTPEQRAL